MFQAVSEKNYEVKKPTWSLIYETTYYKNSPVYSFLLQGEM